MPSFEIRCTTVPSSIPKVHDRIDRYLATMDVDEGSSSDLHVIVDELVSNIEKFAYDGRPGTYSVRIRTTERCLEIELEDEGMEFDPTGVEEAPVAGDDDRPVGHLGILLVKRIAHRFNYTRHGGINVTTVVIRTPRKNNIDEGDR
jgi:serine/threonine-protein kinase RsbW